VEGQAARKEFGAALGGRLGVDERNSQSLGGPHLYVAAPVSGGAVRLAYPLAEIEITDQPLGMALFWGSLTAFVFAMMVAAAASRYFGCALKGIRDFGGPLVWVRLSRSS